jgi:hypothetical protein
MQRGAGMTTRFLCNYPQEERISMQVVDFFTAELIFARSQPEKHTVWVISPWIIESQFDLSERGAMEDFFPEYAESTIPFSAFIKKLLDYGTRVNFVCKAPHDLMNIRVFHGYLVLNDKFKKIGDLFDSIQQLQVEGMSSMTSGAREKKAEVLQQTAKLRSVVDGFRRYQNSAIHTAIGRSDVIAYVQSFKQYAPEQVRIFYNQKLHAKLLIGKYGGFFGSANITYSGLNTNDELWTYVSDPAILQQLHYHASRFAHAEGYGWKMSAEKYSIQYAMEKLIEGYKLEEILTADLPDELCDLLELVRLKER